MLKISPKIAFMLCLLILLGFLGNYYALPLFFGADFLFGSAFVLLILYLFGLGYGLVAAVVVNSYTFVLWGHPYGFIIFTLEILFVGYFLKDRCRNLLLLDGLYWLLIGTPLNGLIYSVILHMDVTTTAFIVLKQGVNGIFNALLVSLAINYIPFNRLLGRSRERRTVSLQESTFNLLVSLVLIPALILTIIQNRNEMKLLESSAIADLQMLSTNVQAHINFWYRQNLNPVIQLAQYTKKSVNSTPEVLQHDTEILNKVFPDFYTIHIENAAGVTIACSPSVNDKGATIGVSLADREWFKEVRSVLKPVLTGAILGKRVTISPTAILSVPVIKDGQFWGAATASLNLQQISKFLEPYSKNKNVKITLIDSNDRVIASTVADRLPLQKWDRNRNGTVSRINSTVYRRSPGEKNLPSMTRWRMSNFVQENKISPEIPWTLIIESPIAPYQKLLYAAYVQYLSILACLVALTLLLALALSRKLAKPLANLAWFTSSLPEMITKHKVIDWPKSKTTEVEALISNFQSMTKALELSFQDIHDQANALNMTLNATADGILAVDADGRIIFYNQQFAKLWQIPQSMLDSGDDNTLLDYVIDQISDRDCFMSEVIRLYNSDDSSFDVIEFKDGRVIERYSFPLQRGEPVLYGRVWSFRNITERRQQETILKSSEYEFRMLADAMPQIVWVCLPDGKNIYLNKQWSDYTGTVIEESTGHNWIKPFHPDDQQVAWDAWQDAIHYGGEYSIECRLRRRDGIYKWWLIRGVPIRDEQGAIIKWFGTCTDIEKIKQYEAQLSQAKVAAESANRAKSEFLANMSHEIRTPMNGVLGMTQLLELSDLSQDQREFVDAIKISGYNLLSLINDILDLSKIEADKIDLHVSAFNLHTCINDIVLMQQSVIHKKRLLLDVVVGADIPHVLLGDQLRVKQILLNLFGNAVKFTSQGSITITAQILEQHDMSALVQIAITDTGIGISSDALAKIFNSFVQEDGSTTRRFGGTGLGLTISRRLTELMGGNISVESTPGVGSCFKVSLPFSFVKKADTEVKAPTQVNISWDGPPLRILFVEDNPISIKFGTSLLKGVLGHNVVTAVNGRECLAELDRGTFDLVLLDIQMPVMNGEETLQEIRRKEIGTAFRQPVIALTAYALRDEKDRFLQEGFDGYVSKPLEISELISEMKRVTGTSQTK
jgi:PAS domain S-box-containing protein